MQTARKEPGDMVWFVEENESRAAHMQANRESGSFTRFNISDIYLIKPHKTQDFSKPVIITQFT